MNFYLLLKVTGGLHILDVFFHIIYSSKCLSNLSFCDVASIMHCGACSNFATWKFDRFLGRALTSTKSNKSELPPYLNIFLLEVFHDRHVIRVLDLYISSSNCKILTFCLFWSLIFRFQSFPSGVCVVQTIKRQLLTYTMCRWLKTLASCVYVYLLVWYSRASSCYLNLNFVRRHRFLQNF